MSDDDLHDILLYGFGVVTGLCIATRAHNNKTIHVIDHDGIGVDREEMR